MRRIAYGFLALATAAAVSAALPAAATTTASTRQATAHSTVTTKHACSVPLRPGGPVCYALIRTDITPVRADALRAARRRAVTGHRIYRAPTTCPR
ncbi:MAG TPA: hypothetical protein VHX38_20740 [Pseudonocardiaceae bacterium]|nr:hypothetical protein [Pseudonocardiaceae bacterium]